MSGVVCSNDGDTHNSPCEQLEAKYPILIERQALRPDSGGAGRRPGGLGTETVVRARSTLSVDVQSDRMHCPPWGLSGGRPGYPIMRSQIALAIGLRSGDLRTWRPSRSMDSSRLFAKMRSRSWIR
jgi:N-methylhydantoinase B/oxoprolinase/acetone carboxylase alpha subunit